MAGSSSALNALKRSKVTGQIISCQRHIIFYWWVTLSANLARLRILAPEEVRYLNFQLLQIKDGGRLPSWKIKKWLYLGNGLPDRHNIWHDNAYWPSEPDQQLKFRTFKKSKTADGRHHKKSKHVVLIYIINSRWHDIIWPVTFDLCVAVA